jgi:hypothetical protein
LSAAAGSLRRRFASSAGLRPPTAPLTRQHLTQRRLRRSIDQVGRTGPADLSGHRRRRRSRWREIAERRADVVDIPTFDSNSPVVRADHDAPQGGSLEPHANPDVLAFARWFADWWLRRGHELAES